MSSYRDDTASTVADATRWASESVQRTLDAYVDMVQATEEGSYDSARMTDAATRLSLGMQQDMARAFTTWAAMFTGLSQTRDADVEPPLNASGTSSRAGQATAPAVKQASATGKSKGANRSKGANKSKGAGPAPVAVPQSTRSPLTDDLARSMATVWIGALKAFAGAAAEFADSMAVLSRPPAKSEIYKVDLSKGIGLREVPITIKVTDQEWATPNDSGDLPVVTVADTQPLAKPEAGKPDWVRFAVSPPVAPKTVLVTIEVVITTHQFVAPEVHKVRLGAESIELDQ